MEQTLQQILTRLAGIERKLGVSRSGDDAGDERNPLAVSFESEIVGGPAKALVEAASKVPGDDGVKLVCLRGWSRVPRFGF